MRQGDQVLVMSLSEPAGSHVQASYCQTVSSDTCPAREALADSQLHRSHALE